MEILGIIPARAGSKGIPGKNIKPLAGMPLIAYTLQSATGSQRLSRHVLTTDSMEIAEIGKHYDIEVPFLRPAELAGDHSSASAYIRHCLDFLQTQEDYCPELVVLLQPTCPLRNSEDIDACIDLLINSDADSVVSVTTLPTKYHPGWQFTVSPGGLLCPYTGEMWGELATARQHLDCTFTRNGAVYAFRREVFLDTNNIYGNKVLAYEMPEERSVNIDDMDDWLKAEIVINSKKKG